MNHNLFKHPYTKIDFLQKDLDIARNTASKYLDELVKGGFLLKHKLKNTNYYVNIALWNILTNH